MSSQRRLEIIARLREEGREAYRQGKSPQSSPHLHMDAYQWSQGYEEEKDCMGQRVGEWVEFNCANDCEPTGCPGHRVRSTFSRTSDTITFEIEGQNSDICFDLSQWEAMKAAA